MIYRKEIFAEIPHISMIPGGVMPVLHCSQYDRSRPLQFILDDADASVHAVTVRGRRPDGAAVTQADITFDDGVYTWDVDETFTEVAGDCVCEVYYTPGDSVIGSQNFILRVEPGPVRAGDPTPWSNVRLTAPGTYNVRPYAEAIVDVPEPAGNIDITENGTHDVSAYKTATVDVQGGGDEPSGVKTINENGLHDVKRYEYANVNVTPSGTIRITENGTHDVADYGSAVVSVQSADAAQAVADFIAGADSVSGVLDLTDYPIETARTYAFYLAPYAEIKLAAAYLANNALSNTLGVRKITVQGAQAVRYRAFEDNDQLTEIHFTGITAVPDLTDPLAFTGTPIEAGSGTIYFPAALVDAAKAATNWADFAAQIVGE